MNTRRLPESELSPKVWFKKWRSMFKFLLPPEGLDTELHHVSRLMHTNLMEIR